MIAAPFAARAEVRAATSRDSFMRGLGARRRVWAGARLALRCLTASLNA